MITANPNRGDHYNQGVGHKHSREDILAGALEVAFDDGLSQLTFGRLAKRLGISDRIVVYYFPTKSDLIGEVVIAMGLRLQETLMPAFSVAVADHREMVRRAWPLLATPEHDRVFALFFEANGLAAVGREPYSELVPTLITMWIEWAAEFIDDAVDQRAEATAAISMIDGLLLLRQLAGPQTADRAARTVGAA